MTLISHEQIGKHEWHIILRSPVEETVQLSQVISRRRWWWFGMESRPTSGMLTFINDSTNIIFCLSWFLFHNFHLTAFRHVRPYFFVSFSTLRFSVFTLSFPRFRSRCYKLRKFSFSASDFPLFELPKLAPFATAFTKVGLLEWEKFLPQTRRLRRMMLLGKLAQGLLTWSFDSLLVLWLALHFPTV